MSSTFKSQISNEIFPISERVSGYSIRKSLLTFIQQQYPNFKIDSYLSIHELNHFREKYISQALRDEKGQLTELEDKVMLSMQDQTVLTGELDHETTEPLPLGNEQLTKLPHLEEAGHLL
jgi:hypothetical protein